MANNDPKPVSNLDVITTVNTNDSIILCQVSNGHVGIITVNNFLLNVTSNNIIAHTITTNNILVLNNYTPVNSSSNALAGAFWSDGSYVYFAIANGNITRVALSSF